VCVYIYIYTHIYIYIYIYIYIFTTATLPTLFQASCTKSNFRTLYVECVAFQYFSRRRAYKDKIINCGFQISMLFAQIKRKTQLESWIRDVFLHLSTAN